MSLFGSLWEHCRAALILFEIWSGSKVITLQPGLQHLSCFTHMRCLTNCFIIVLCTWLHFKHLHIGYMYAEVLYKEREVTYLSEFSLIQYSYWSLKIFMLEAIALFTSVLSLLSPHFHPGHAKEALDLARMQEQTTQMEYQSKMKVMKWKHTHTQLLLVISSCRKPVLL